MAIFTRLKRRFTSARAAWADIGKATGLEPKDVRTAGHTSTKWRWQTRKSNPGPSKSMARKKARSAKQKAATRKLVAMNKRKRSPKRRSPKRKSPRRKRKVNKVKSKSKHVAKRDFLSKIPLVSNPLFKKAAIGVGTATLGAAIIGIVAPQIAQNAIVRPALAFVGGGIPGVIAQVVAQGGLSQLRGLVGGSGGTQSMNNAGSNGFA